MNIKYISIKSVLYDLSLTIDDRYWNEIRMQEWIAHGLRQLPLESGLVDKVAQVEVVSHKAQLPSDFRFLTQIAAYSHPGFLDESEIALIDGPACVDCPSSGSLTHVAWKAMRLTSSPYHESICLDNSIQNCQACEHSFSISPALTITTTLNNGWIMVAYKGYPVDEDGGMLMPDDESLKEALLHYVLYRYWLSKYTMKEDGAEGRMRFHLQMWDTLSKKALSLNNPDVSQLENLKNIHNTLAPRSNRFQQLFLTTSNREHVNY